MARDRTKSSGKAGRKSRPDQHASGFLVRLPQAWRGAIGDLAGRNRRPMTAEILIALEERFAKLGLPIPDTK